MQVGIQMSKYRLIQQTTFNDKGEFNEEFIIQKNYGTIIPEWINLTDEVYLTKNDGLNALETINKRKPKTIKKTIKVIK